MARSVSASASVAKRKSRIHGLSPMSDYVFEGERHAHAPAHAKRRNASLGFALQHLVEKRDRDARARATNGMTEREGAAVDVHLATVEMKLTVAGEDLRGEGLVQFDEIEVGQFETVFLLHLVQSRNRANAHDARIDSGGRNRKNAGERLEVVFLGE